MAILSLPPAEDLTDPCLLGCDGQPHEEDPAYWWSLPMPRFDSNDDLDDELVGEDLADWELEALAADQSPLQEAQ
jgi:hypothetical protein